MAAVFNSKGRFQLFQCRLSFSFGFNIFFFLCLLCCLSRSTQKAARIFLCYPPTLGLHQGTHKRIPQRVPPSALIPLQYLS